MPNESDLRKRLIRLAHTKPELRSDLLPLIKQASNPVADAIDRATPVIAEALLPKDLSPANRQRMLGVGGLTLRRSIAHLLEVKIKRDLHNLAVEMESLDETMDFLSD